MTEVTRRVCMAGIWVEDGMFEREHPNRVTQQSPSETGLYMKSTSPFIRCPLRLDWLDCLATFWQLQRTWTQPEKLANDLFVGEITSNSLSQTRISPLTQPQSPVWTTAF